MHVGLKSRPKYNVLCIKEKVIRVQHVFRSSLQVYSTNVCQDALGQTGHRDMLFPLTGAAEPPPSPLQSGSRRGKWPVKQNRAAEGLGSTECSSSDVDNMAAWALHWKTRAGRQLVQPLWARQVVYSVWTPTEMTLKRLAMNLPGDWLQQQNGIIGSTEVVWKIALLLRCVVSSLPAYCVWLGVLKPTLPPLFGGRVGGGVVNTFMGQGMGHHLYTVNQVSVGGVIFCMWVNVGSYTTLGGILSIWKGELGFPLGAMGWKGPKKAKRREPI